jgi:glycosyltransferase involved in cell wall biosynthesis
MMRVLVVEPAGNLWGSERAFLDVAGWMPDVQVGVCCPPDRPIRSELEKASIRTFPYFVYGLHEKSKWGRLRAAIGVARACLEFRPDILHLNQGGCYRVVLPAAFLFNLPIIAHVRIFEDAAYYAERNPDPRRLRGLIAVSRAVEVELKAHPQLADISVHVLYDAYSPSSQEEQSIARTEVDHRIGCVGRIVPTKGQDILIETMHWLRKHGDDKAECVFVGDGPRAYLERMKTAAAQGPGASAINWLGVRSDVVSFLRTCGVLACPSRREPLGRVIFEAWDAGAIPVACAASGGAAEVIAAAGGGILYPEQKPALLAQALQTALRLPEEDTARLIGNGRAWVSHNCHPKRYGEILAGLLKEACRSKQGRQKSKHDRAADWQG